MGVVRSWLLGVTAAALVVALAETLAPEGSVKKVCRLAGGLALLLAALRPLAGMTGGEPAAQTAGGWRERAQRYEQELAQQFQVLSIPTLVVIKNGKVVNQSAGAKSKADILAMLTN